MPAEKAFELLLLRMRGPIMGYCSPSTNACIACRGGTYPWNIPPRPCRVLLIFADPSLCRCYLNFEATYVGAFGTLDEYGRALAPITVPLQSGAFKRVYGGARDERSLLLGLPGAKPDEPAVEFLFMKWRDAKSLELLGLKCFLLSAF